eukprot:TRINITY_DN27924_c0_g1_i1.p1 TRINITY_DN27924_c0_g1~~TRINITY_DN27924_c0_g1_i1.p1  ORF type:complete len:347 (+),score=55.65 TRINITY_DN27924_c0_g1_i1:88-1041(+)
MSKSVESGTCKTEAQVLGSPQVLNEGDIDIQIDSSCKAKPEEMNQMSLRNQDSVSESTADHSGAVETQSQTSQTTSQEQSSYHQYPRRKLAGFALMWAILVVSILMRGGRATPGAVSYCSPMYWILVAVTVVALAVLGIVQSLAAISMSDSQPPDNGAEEEAELCWTKSTTIQIALWSLFAGTLAALCGIGGGMVMGPKLLDLGFKPQVQSATTATTLFIMSSSTALAFLVQGTAPFDYAIFLGLFTALGAVVGKAVIGFVVKKTRRPSVIMFLLGGIICVSVIVMVITGLADVISDIRQGEDLWFRGLCSVDGDSK